jgi:hypothetical protein
VRFAWYRITKSFEIPDNKYLVLGDDIVISDTKLAMEYKEVCIGFNIVLSLAKSYEGATIINFASQLINNKGENFSPLSIKEITQARTLSHKLEFARRLARLGFIGASSSSLFRTFFHPDLWKKETVLLTQGKVSSFGRRVHRCLSQPDGQHATMSTYLSSFKEELSVFNPPKVLDRPEYLTGQPIRNDRQPSITFALQRLVKLLDLEIEDFYFKARNIVGKLSLPDIYMEFCSRLPRKIIFSKDHLNKYTYEAPIFLQDWAHTINIYLTLRRDPVTGWAGYDPFNDKVNPLERARSTVLNEMRRSFNRFNNDFLSLGKREDQDFSPLLYITDLF